MSVLHQDARRDAFAWASHFRDIFHACLTSRSDALFELTDALLCADGPVTSPVDLNHGGQRQLQTLVHVQTERAVRVDVRPEQGGPSAPVLCGELVRPLRLGVLNEGGYEIVRCDTTGNEHEVTTTNSVNDIAGDLTIWMAARSISAR
ncbi:hypothetical protein [Streptomyces adustus]|uniref:hypothetical protein n=1 Tax=Streptomyces adustus TaxID=1609272 RepID=UPI00192E37F7|nr:hypothetical protein [Streptomyces adustus]